MYANQVNRGARKSNESMTDSTRAIKQRQPSAAYKYTKLMRKKYTCVLKSHTNKVNTRNNMYSS